MHSFDCTIWQWYRTDGQILETKYYSVGIISTGNKGWKWEEHRLL